MKIEIRHAKHATLRSNSCEAECARPRALLRRHDVACCTSDSLDAFHVAAPGDGHTPLHFHPAPRNRAFTLLEVLLALVVLSIVMVVVHSIFYGALQLRNKADQAFEDAIPLQHALTLIRRDLANLTAPGGTLTGTLQTSLTTSSTTSSSHSGQQCGPSFYTASGTLDESSPWSEMRKVSYYLVPPTNNTAGLDLIRSVTRNLLPVSQEEYSDQVLMGSVSSLAFQFYNGSQWADTWDSTSVSSAGSSNTLPQAIRVQLTLITDEKGTIAQTPIEMVIPVTVQAATNLTASTTGGGG
jgi:type II secretion system protein J